jgi:3-methylcrotonyl-CoA carboxylase alpha subunit
MFRKVLIANRGEIAVRIATTLQQMGIRVVAVHSDADRAALHVRAADEAYALPGTSAADTYLRGDAILAIAAKCKAEAIHPGYGFLSENAAFAEACAAAGVKFVGPRPDAIRAVGDKIRAKETMAKAGVPVVPGFVAGPNDGAAAISAGARSVGYPLLVKAAAGGGGRGMRRVDREADLAPALDAAAREARSAFGDPRVFLEKYVVRPRHVEVQVLADEHGNVFHFFERECSIQRRYQKIVEETPSPALTAKTRAAMGRAAVDAARAVGYVNAGTVEFILDESGAFYFLEVNTRLQVEHPVTEATLRRDLVRLQLEVASGERLALRQEDLVPEGHSFEARIYAEDPAHDFRPSIGTIRRFVPPHAPWIRVDTGVGEGAEVTPHYDAMLAKLIVWGADRRESLARLRWALARFVVLGVRTNVEFLQAVAAHPEFEAGRLHTHFLDEHRIAAAPTGDPPHEAVVAAAWASLREPAEGRSPSADAAADPWRDAAGWRSL